MRKIAVYSIIVFVLFIPVWTWLIWTFSPSQALEVFILDKTVLSEIGTEHRALNWVLTHRKFTKDNGEFYDIATDYFGFFPKDNYQFDIKDLKDHDSIQIDSLSAAYDMLYYTDAYGIYRNEWFGEGDPKERSPIVYGGLHHREVDLLAQMKAKKKPIITEFNIIQNPTSSGQRKRVEELFGFEWSGWTGRYFYSMDTTLDHEIPKWMMRMYANQYKKTWDFQNSGVVLLNEDDFIVVLEEGVHLKDGVPHILTNQYNSDKFGVVKDVNFPFWFEIMNVKDPTHEIISEYQLFTNSKGDALLQAFGLHNNFPAVVRQQKNYKWWYFAGDFADNPHTRQYSASLKWITVMNSFLYNPRDISDRQRFFWTYYEPLMSDILNGVSIEL